MKISILIPTLNNPEHVRLVVNAFRQNTINPFEILVHSNSISGKPSPQMKELAKEMKFDYFQESADNLGVAKATNQLANHATGDIICYTGDDIYCVPGWDAQLIAKLNPNIHYQYLTGVMIGPTHINPMMHAPIYYGQPCKDWNEEKFLAGWFDKRTITQDIISVLGPVFVRKELWDEIGGFDESFWPGFGTDPDLIAKIYFAALKKNEPYEFRGVCDCGMYHFECIGNSKLNDAAKYRREATHQFKRKWKMYPLELHEKLHAGETINE